MNTTLQSCKDVIWGDLDQQKLYPFVRPILAHYTSVATLEKIMVNNELWLSHPLLMNDDQEMKWGMLEGKHLFTSHEGIRRACGTEERIKTLIGSFEDAHEHFSNTHAYDVYISCFCNHDPADNDGLLSMWRAYGANGGGAAIVFDTGKLIASDNSPLILAPVVYASNEERQRLITEKLNALAALIENDAPSIEDLAEIGQNFMERLKLFALFTKHPGFQEEKEWRLVYMRDRDPTHLYESMLSYAVTDRGLQPKFKLQLIANSVEASLDYSVATLVQSILLGPTAGSPLSVMAVKRMLSQSGKPQMADLVRMSSTPFRT